MCMMSSSLALRENGWQCVQAGECLGKTSSFEIKTIVAIV